jgi:AcrR family transcriptional regulator
MFQGGHTFMPRNSVARKAVGSPRIRRRQVDRSKLTKSLIIDAAIRVIETRGYHWATIQDIAREAEVTPGAVQHHFSTKDELILQVVESVFQGSSGRGAIWPDSTVALKQRAEIFLQSAWEKIYASNNYLALWSLFFGCRGAQEVYAMMEARRLAVRESLDDGFYKTFPEISANSPNRKALSLLVSSTLRGLGVVRLFEDPPVAIKDQLSLLVRLIVQEAEQATRSKART